MTSVGELVESTASQLGSTSEARWIVEQVTGWGDSSSFSPSYTRRQVPDRMAAEVAQMVGRRRCGEPLQYVLGTWGFRSLDVSVDHRVLVPRPETEQIVDCALEQLQKLADSAAPGPPVVVADLGTGSGVIALSIATEASVPRAGSLEVWATDASSDALDVARCNLSLLAGVDPVAARRVRLSQGSWFDALPTDLAGRVQMLVANPPYVSASEWEGLEPVVRDHEPRHALVAGETGLEVLELLVSGAPRWLAPGGVLVLEMAPHQARFVAQEARLTGFAKVEVHPDLAGLPRALVARMAGA